MGFLMNHSVPRQGDVFSWKSRAEDQGWISGEVWAEKHQKSSSRVDLAQGGRAMHFGRRHRPGSR